MTLHIRYQRNGLTRPTARPVRHVPVSAPSSPSFALWRGRLLEPLAPKTPRDDGRGGDGGDNTSHS